MPHLVGIAIAIGIGIANRDRNRFFQMKEMPSCPIHDCRICEDLRDLWARKIHEGKEETIGERLVRLRREQGITQVELADILGVAQPMVSGYERGRLPPTES